MTERIRQGLAELYTSPTRIGRETVDKVRLGIEAMLGVREAMRDRNVRPFRGLREAYVFCTGDVDCTFRDGGFAQVSEAITTSTFPELLLNALNKKLIQDFEAIGMGGVERLFAPTDIFDFRTQSRVRLGYLSDFPTVAEGAPYTEFTPPGDELVQYSPVKKGGIQTITEETIRNDDLGKVRQYPERLARAGIHTLKSYVTAFFTSNPTYAPDSLTWFHATHNNLRSTALSSAELDQCQVAMNMMTKTSSGNPIRFPLEWIMVPPALEPTARQINRNQTGTNNWFNMFGEGNENIIVNELLTANSTTLYYGGCFPERAPFLEIGFLDGIRHPHIFLANLPTQGTLFTNDEIQYKAKFVFGGAPVDYRGVWRD
jgi:hypothetical protein